MKHFRLTIALFLLMSLLCATMIAGAATYTIKFGLSNDILTPENDCEATWALTFKKLVEAESKGEIVVDLYPNKQLGNAAEMLNGVAAGTIEMSTTNMNSFATIYKDSMALSCPGLFSNEAEVDAVMETPWAKEYFKKMAEATNVLVLSARSNGMRCFTTSNKKLTTVDSAKGVTWRVMESPLSVKMVESIGANAVPMAGSEMYTAMQNGTVDGQENPIAAIVNDRTYEVQKYMVVDNHMASIVAYTLTYDFYTSLPAELQKVIDDAAKQAGIDASAVTANINANGVETLTGFGMEVYIPTEEELKGWQTPIFEASNAYLRAEIGNETLDALSAEIAAYRAK